MKEYYIHDGTDQKGPMTLEDLLKSGINGETLVWYEGLEGWTPAKNLEELQLLFERKSPPPFEQPPPAFTTTPPSHSGNIPSPDPAKKSSGRRIYRKAIAFFLTIAGIVFVIFVLERQNIGRGQTSRATYSESKMSVVDYERSHPAEFLDADGTYNPTLFGNKMKVHGTVTNKATVANFKDIVIKVAYYSATKTLINTEQFVLYEYVPAHSKKSFEWKIKPPGGTNSMSWDAINATPY